MTDLARHPLVMLRAGLILVLQWVFSSHSNPATVPLGLRRWCVLGSDYLAGLSVGHPSGEILCHSFDWGVNLDRLL